MQNSSDSQIVNLGGTVIIRLLTVIVVNAASREYEDFYPVVSDGQDSHIANRSMGLYIETFL